MDLQPALEMRHEEWACTGQVFGLIPSSNWLLSDGYVPFRAHYFHVPRELGFVVSTSEKPFSLLQKTRSATRTLASSDGERAINFCRGLRGRDSFVADFLGCLDLSSALQLSAPSPQCTSSGVTTVCRVSALNASSGRCAFCRFNIRVDVAVSRICLRMAQYAANFR